MGSEELPSHREAISSIPMPQSSWDSASTKTVVTDTVPTVTTTAETSETLQIEITEAAAEVFWLEKRKGLMDE